MGGCSSRLTIEPSSYEANPRNLLPRQSLQAPSLPPIVSRSGVGDSNRISPNNADVSNSKSHAVPPVAMQEPDGELEVKRLKVLKKESSEKSSASHVPYSRPRSEPASPGLGPQSVERLPTPLILEKQGTCAGVLSPTELRSDSRTD